MFGFDEVAGFTHKASKPATILAPGSSAVLPPSYGALSSALINPGSLIWVGIGVGE